MNLTNNKQYADRHPVYGTPGYSFGYNIDQEKGVLFSRGAKMTKRQIRQFKRAVRNGTHWLFDEFGPPATPAGMNRMKGAKQAYKRRPKTWAI